MPYSPQLPDAAVMAQEREARLQKFKTEYFHTAPDQISQLAADGMIVVIDQEARALAAEACVDHEENLRFAAQLSAEGARLLRNQAEATIDEIRAQVQALSRAARNLTPSDHPTDRRAVIVSRYWFEKLSKFALVSGDACGQDMLQQSGGQPAEENRWVVLAALPGDKGNPRKGCVTVLQTLLGILLIVGLIWWTTWHWENK